MRAVNKITNEDAGTRAFDLLCEYPGGLNRKMWRYHTGLSESQLARGLDWVRDLFEHEPFVRNWIGGEWIYMLAVDDRAVREHAERQLRTQITRALRDYNWWHNVATKHASQENARQEEMARRRLLDLRYAHETIFSQVTV